MAQSRISQLVQAEKNNLAGLDPQDQAMMDKLRLIEEAEKRVTEKAVPEGKRLMMEKSVRLDRHNVRRFLVKLTPSMCTAKDCGFDAAIEAGYRGGWNDDNLHAEQVLPNGQTVGEALARLLDYHARTAHAVSHSHILTEEEAQRRKSWGSVPQPFLTGAQG
jgi:hypothetical protein